MIDALITSISSICELSRFCIDLVKFKSVDTSLQDEINSLSQVLSNIDSFLASAVLDGREAEHWRNVKQSMADCQETLARLGSIFENVKKDIRMSSSPASKGILISKEAC